MRYSRLPFTLALLTLTIPSIALFAAGCLRYGGVDGLVQRVQIEIDRHQPHPEFVPTALAVATIQDLVDLGITQPATISTISTISTTVASTTATLLLPTITPPPHSEQPIRISATVSISQSPTLEPAISTPTFTPTPLPLHQSARSAVELTGFRHEWQTWNNCGPATLSFYLSYYGSTLTQAVTGSALRTHQDDKNVGPYEIANFAANQGYGWDVRVNGNSDLIRTFVTNGIPVLIETWHEAEPNNGMGHYRLISGYDDAAQHWIAYDSYDTLNLIQPDGPYRGIRLAYAETDLLWKVFNRLYVVIYPQEKQPLVHSIFGAELSEAQMSQVAALEQARTEIAADPNDAFAWFNLGSMLAELNNPADAAAAFDRARQIGLPWRMLWYQHAPFDVYSQMGRHQEVLTLADATLRNVTTIEEIYLWKGRALAALGDVEGARQQWQQALALNPSFTAAQSALAAIGSQ